MHNKMKNFAPLRGTKVWKLQESDDRSENTLNKLFTFYIFVINNAA